MRQVVPIIIALSCGRQCQSSKRYFIFVHSLKITCFNTYHNTDINYRMITMKPYLYQRALCYRDINYKAIHYMVVCYSAIYIVAISFEPISYRAMGQPISIFKVLFIEKNILCNFIPSKVNLCSLNSTQADLPTITHSIFIITSAKPRVSLTVPNCDYFKRVSLTVLDTFLDAIAKAKKLIPESIAQNLK